MKEDTSEQSNKCTEGEKVFITKSSLNKHLIDHTENKPVECTECDMVFNRKDKLMRHQKIHTGGNHMNVIECDKAQSTHWAENINLLTVTRHSLERKRKCNMNVHTRQKPQE